MKKVLLSKPINPAGMKVLEGKVDPIILSDSNIGTVKKMVEDVEGIVLRTNIKVTREIIKSAPKLKVISRTGVGVDNVDVAAATKRGILVCHTPGVNSNSVAEQTLALLLGLAKQLKIMDKAVCEENWKIRNAGKTVDAEGKTLGLIGVGRIGSLVACKCRLAFNMKVIAYDPYLKEVEGIELYPNLDQVFKEADFISIHAPLSHETRGLLSKREFAMMKPSAVLVNTSRGPVVDEAALIEALEQGKIAAAALDVTAQEPPAPDNPLRNMDNVILTPHIAWYSERSAKLLGEKAAQEVVRVFKGYFPKALVNPEVVKIRTDLKPAD